MADKKNNLFLNEKLQVLEELVRKVYKLISPIPYSDNLKWLINQDEKNKLFERNPKCFLKLKFMGKDILFFPVCNRFGIIDPKMITLSLKMVDKLSGNNNVDQDALIFVANKLKILQSKYSKEIPRPVEVASRKALVTKFINNVIKKYRLKK